MYMHTWSVFLGLLICLMLLVLLLQFFCDYGFSMYLFIIIKNILIFFSAF